MEIITFFLLFLSTLTLAWVWLKYKYSYWDQRGVSTSNYSYFWGNAKEAIFQEKSFTDGVRDYYKTFKSQGSKHGGIFFLWNPIYIALDINVVKSIMQSDFQHFVDRGIYYDEKNDPLSAHLFSLAGKKWKLLRSKLSPTFTSGKMKMMYDTLVDCTEGLFKVIDKDLENPVDIKDVLGRFTTDIIGSCAFGLDCNSLENPDSEFRAKGVQLFNRPFPDNIRVVAAFAMPQIAKMFKMKLLSSEVNDFFMGVVRDNVAYRENNKIFRKDFMHLLIQLKNRGKLVEDEKLNLEKITKDDNKITLDEIAAQAFIFFEAGFETSSTTMTFCLYELAKNKDIQEKARKEIIKVLSEHDGQLTYEALMDMEYLDRAVNETLRKYPPLAGLSRICTKEYKVPGSDIVLEKGVRVMIPVSGIHHDPDYYPNPEIFDPDRFTEENRKTRPAFSFLPFGEGPRVCIEIMEVFNTFSLLLIAALIFGCLLVKNSLSYWSRRGLDTPPYSLLFGHMKSAFTREIAFIDRMLKFYRYFKSMGLRHGGLYFVWSPVYMPLDLNIIKHITQIDFQHFHSRGLYSNEKNDPLSGNLFTLEGKKWKLLRHKLTPTFSSGKMKMMFPTMVECTKGLHKVIDKELGGPVDIKDILGRFTTDIIGSCAFGLDCNSLENPDSEFRKKGKSILHRKGLENLKQAMFFTLPNITKRFNVFVFPVKVTEFFMKIVKDTVTYREEHNVLRKDFMDLLIQLKNKGKLVDDDKWSSDLINEADNKITMNEIAAQVVVFFFAGFETSATTMSFCLYEVSKNKSIQDRIREEIRRVLQGHDGKLTYEALMEMSYLDQVVNETLRKYPPVPGLPRICNKDYKVPGTDLVLEKGVRVMISVAGIHHDPDYYADPEKFDPDRFSEDNKKNLTPNSFLPFGEGPRYCIGARFGLMQTKVGLVALLLNYELSINKKTQEPLQFDPEFVVASTKGGLWLDFKKISNISIH